MVRSEGEKTLFDKMMTYFSKEEPILKEMSRTQLEADCQYFRDNGLKHLYDKIKTGDGVPCDICAVPVTADIYGGVIKTDSTKDEFKVTCRRCTVPNSGLGW